MFEFLDKTKRYLPFNASEIKSVTITILVLTFIVGINDGAKTFIFSNWLRNLIYWFIIVILAVVVKQVGHRLVAVYYGYRYEYRLWWFGIVLGLMFALVSNGNLWLLIPGGFIAHHLQFHRTGMFRYGLRYKDLSFIAIGGAIANILFASFVKTLEIWFHLFPEGSVLVQNIFVFNLWFAVCNLLPIPPLDGSKILFESRLVYVFFVSIVVFYCVLAYLQLYSFIIPIILGTLVWYFYWQKFEK
jgi:Zn-dependent protease